MNGYLTSVKKEFASFKSLGDRSFEQLSDEHIFWQANENSNSIATIVKHLSGNMLSRWTDFLRTDGEKSWRKRDSEFENDLETREDMLELWETGWNCLFNTLNSLSDNDLEKTIRIRNEEHSVIEAINRQLAHYPYHVGQIVFLAKMLKPGEWTSLSIPKGGSDHFNSIKFGHKKS